jgi:type II secretory pathway component PulC
MKIGVFTLLFAVLLPLTLSAAPPSNLRLAGTSLGPGPADAFAVIEELTTHRQFSRTNGQTVGDAMILEIREGKVLLKQGDEVMVWLISEGLPSHDTSASAPAGKPVKSPEPNPSGIAPSYRTDISELQDPEEIRKLLYPPLRPETEVTRYPVSQETVGDLRTDLEKLLAAQQLTIVKHPTLGDGLQVDANTAQAFRELGLQNGDLLLKANGLSLVNADQVPTLIDSLSRAKIINLVAVRGDDLISIHLAVQ